METTHFRRLPEAEFYGNFPEEINGFWNDTRTLRPGDCFLALVAQRDGHDFLPDAQRCGASCALVSRINKNLTLPQLCVGDVFEAAKTLTKIHREHRNIIAITGSYGKTSTKDMLRLLLGRDAYATEENLNNELGVVLSLSRIKSHPFGAIECGISHPGDMDCIIDLVKPNISITTGITFTHVCNFTDFEQLVKEKCKILEDTLLRQNIGIIAESCLAYAPFRRLANQCIIVGSGENIKQFPNFTHFQWIEKDKVILRGKYFEAAPFRLPEMSLGQRENFAKTATVAKILGYDDGTIAERILRWEPNVLRGGAYNFRGHEVYLDCYNANPVAMLDALKFFEQKFYGSKGNTYLLGGMRELGRFSDRFHRQLAKHFRGKKDAVVFAIGKEMRILFEYLKAEGNEVYYFEDAKTGADFFKANMRGNIFIKGSYDYQLLAFVKEG